MSLRARRAALALASTFATTGLLVASCATPRGGELDPRYVAVHNAFSAIGLAQVGPLQQGTLDQGRESRVSVDLTAQCVTLVGVGGDGVRDLDVSLLDPSGKQVAHDTTREPQAVVRACLDTPGTYTLVVRMSDGAGTFVAATWSGGVAAPSGSSAPASPIAAAQQGAGTCESPIPLASGTVTGNTTHGESEQEGSCGNKSADSKELVYRIDVRERQRAIFEVSAHFDTVLYLRRDDCGDSNNEVGCNDDSPDQTHSRIEQVLDPGTYFVIVDGYNRDSGQFRLTAQLADVPSVSDVCRRARALALGAQTSGSTANEFDDAHATCGGGAKGADEPFRFDLPQRARVRITESSSDFSPVVSMRRACADEQSEVACGEAGMSSGESTWAGVLDAATYAVWADGRDQGTSGHFTIMAESAPEQGAGTSGDSCGDAIPLRAADHEVQGDTFLARDDVASKCGGESAGDVFYRIDLSRRARVGGHFAREEGRHVFVLSRACGDRSSEIACGPELDEALAPGTYFLAVDGAQADTLGRYEFEWHERDLGGQEAACRNPPLLVNGQDVNATTAGAGDKWANSCAGPENGQASADRVYKFTLAQRANVRLELTTPTWDGVLIVRQQCVDTGASVASMEVACVNDTDDAHHARVEQEFEAGTYYVVVDGHQSGNEGPFTLSYRVNP